ncbi:MAG: FAD-dependent oxidoreductase [Parvularculaceae bacterium]|nr:FAD-dependent oxidoreductase [Parvularculaceae bacterium]
MLTNFMLSTPAEGETATREKLLDDGLAALNPAIAGALDKSRRAVMPWGRHPQVKGSYAGPLIGQYTTLVEAGAPPELGGRLHFAGEHTSAKSMGFMNGAVESGERAAREILGG